MAKKKTNTTDVDILLEECIENIRKDRAHTDVLLLELTQHLNGNPERNEKLGAIAAKYLETMQRSNEQLVKITEIVRKRRGPDESSFDGLSEEDKESLLDEINGSGE